MNFDNIEPKPAVCRQSSISCAVACERKWWCQYHMGITTRGTQVRESADLGTIYHKLQHEGQGNEDKVKNWVAKWQRELVEKDRKGEDLDGNALRVANQLTSLYKKAEAMAHLFWDRYPQPSYMKVIGTEIKWTIELWDLIIQGTIDKLLYNEKDGDAAWIRDHKSTGMSLAVVFGGMQWSIQARIYRLLALDFLKKYTPQPGPLKGFILDGIVKPGIKCCGTDEKNAKKWECSVEDAYLRRVEEWYKAAEVKAELNNDPYTKSIHSQAMFYTENLYPDELRHQLERMKDLYGRPNHPDNFDRDVSRQACYVFRKPCIYMPLCTTNPDQWDSLFETVYKFSETVVEDEENEEDSV